MATYKVLQDIEAEDKILGPLTLKQLVFAIVAALIVWLEYLILRADGAGVLRWPFFAVLLVPFGIFAFLASPIGRDQPNDIWLLARLRFIVKPHQRIWNQDGMSQLVTVTAPKRQEMRYSNGLSQNEVQSRLQALASTLDSRGWAVKNVNVNMFAQPGYADDTSDRLVAGSTLPQNDIASDVGAADDMLDPANNRVAHQLDELMQASSKSHRQQIVESIKQGEPAKKSEDFWFMHDTPPAGNLPRDYATFQSSPVVHPGQQTAVTAVPTSEEKAIVEKLETEAGKTSAWKSHLRTIRPLGDQPAAPAGQTAQTDVPADGKTAAPATNSTADDQPPNPPAAAPNPAILDLANNDDLNVATIARQAKRLQQGDDGEVVISLR